MHSLDPEILALYSKQGSFLKGALHQGPFGNLDTGNSNQNTPGVLPSKQAAMVSFLVKLGCTHHPQHPLLLSAYPEFPSPEALPIPSPTERVLTSNPVCQLKCAPHWVTRTLTAIPFWMHTVVSVAVSPGLSALMRGSKEEQAIPMGAMLGPHFPRHTEASRDSLERQKHGL